jgi:hypothetical protein
MVTSWFIGVGSESARFKTATNTSISNPLATTAPILLRPAYAVLFLHLDSST